MSKPTQDQQTRAAQSDVPVAVIMAENARGRRPRSASAPRRPARVRCLDCGEEGQTTGHMTCQYPQDHD